MSEQTLSGGSFGDRSIPVAPSSALSFVVHGGFFGGVPVGPSPASPEGPAGDFDFVLVDNLLEFGTPCEVQPAGGRPYLVAHGGIFRAAHTEVDVQSGTPVTTNQPNVGVRALEFAEPWYDADLVVAADRTGRSRLYRLHDVQPDGEAGRKLMLHEVPA